MNDPEYFDFLNGKRVAIVGPAAYLTNLGTGPFIDDFDVVVRINRGMELIDTYSESIGCRTDILYNCLIKSPDNGGDLNIKSYHARGVKWVSTIPGSDINGFCKSKKLHKMVSRIDVFKLKRNFNFHVMNHRDYSIVNKHIESRSNTGFAAIFDLLNHGVSKLYVTGFSFYLDSFMAGYKQGCTRDEQEFARQCYVSERHKQIPQWQYLKSEFGDNKRLLVDPVLKKILDLNELSRDLDLTEGVIL